MDDQEQKWVKSIDTEARKQIRGRSSTGFKIPEHAIHEGVTSDAFDQALLAGDRDKANFLQEKYDKRFEHASGYAQKLCADHGIKTYGRPGTLEETTPIKAVQRILDIWDNDPSAPNATVSAYEDAVKVVRYKQDHAPEDDKKKKIISQTEEPEQVPNVQMVGYPTALTRVTLFKAIAKHDQNVEPTTHTTVIENAWGKLTVAGPILSIETEDVFIGLLRLRQIHNDHKFTVSKPELCRAMGKSAGHDVYRSILRSIRYLARIYMELEGPGGAFGGILRGTTQDGAVIGSSTGTEYEESLKRGKITIDFHPGFIPLLDTYLTKINIEFRQSLSGGVTKAIYRFYTSQGPGPYSIHLNKLAAIIRLTEDKTVKPSRGHKRSIKNSLLQLRDRGFFKSAKIVQGNDGDKVNTVTTGTYLTLSSCPKIPSKKALKKN